MSSTLHMRRRNFARYRCSPHPPCFAQSAQPLPRPADLIVTNTVIHTVHENRRLALAVPVRSGRIVFVGSDRGAITYRGRSTRVTDLDIEYKENRFCRKSTDILTRHRFTTLVVTGLTPIPF